MEDVCNTRSRFYDGVGESGNMLLAIEGFNAKPLVSLEEATETLIPLIPDIQSKVQKAKKRAPRHADGLSVDESASIALYTMEWRPYNQSLYYILNKTLRDENRQSLKPWFSYLKLVLTALSRLPTQITTVYRGVALPDRAKYQPGNSVFWWAFSSCSTSKDVAENDHFFGENTERILFIIECINGIDIGRHSHFRSEKEILLLPARTLEVISSERQKDNSYVIRLKEIPSPEPLIEPIPIIPGTKSVRMSSVLKTLRPLIAITKNYFNPSLDAEIAQFKERSDVSLFRKRFSDDDIAMIVEEVIVNKECPALFLTGNEITCQGVIFVAESLENNQTLERLYLTDVHISDIGTQTLAQALSNDNNLTLKLLGLVHNGITDEGAEHLATMLKTNHSLTHLCLPKNHISDRGIQALAKVLIENETLQVLSLEWNRFQNDLTVQSLIEMIETNRTLIQVDIDGRGLSGAAIRKLNSTAKKNSNFTLNVR